jgi:hypothetical protein
MGFAQLLYVSRSLLTREREAAELDAILASARRSNENLDLTGCLGFWNGCFVQILEGSPDGLALAMTRIEGDRRHADIVVRMRREIGTRSFPNWRMAHVPANDAVIGMGDPAKLPAVVLLSELMRIADRGGVRNAS